MQAMMIGKFLKIIFHRNIYKYLENPRNTWIFFQCECSQDRERGVIMKKECRVKLLYNFDVRCPCCNRKLMIVNLVNYNKPKVRLLRKTELGQHSTETRCPICKSFVAVDV